MGLITRRSQVQILPPPPSGVHVAGRNAVTEVPVSEPTGFRGRDVPRPGSSPARCSGSDFPDLDQIGLPAIAAALLLVESAR